jgi:hypothetical protein
MGAGEPLHFLDLPIEVVYLQPPILEKEPGCPDGFIWSGQEYRVIELLAEWRDNRRRGRMARNMSPEHAERALLKGSWGVGRFFFRVRVDSGQVFEIYYDRAPLGADDRKGHWFIYLERAGL